MSAAATTTRRYPEGVSKQELIKKAEALEARVAALDADRDQFLDEVESALNRLRKAAGLPDRDLRAALKAKGNGADAR